MLRIICVGLISNRRLTRLCIVSSTKLEIRRLPCSQGHIISICCVLSYGRVTLTSTQWPWYQKHDLEWYRKHYPHTKNQICRSRLLSVGASGGFYRGRRHTYLVSEGSVPKAETETTFIHQDKLLTKHFNFVYLNRQEIIRRWDTRTRRDIYHLICLLTYHWTINRTTHSLLEPSK